MPHVPATETLVNTTTAGDQANPKITALADGGWVVTWMLNRDGFSIDGIFQQAYHADGTPMGGEVSYDTPEGYQAFHETAPLADGGWVVLWGNWWTGIFQQVYNADGTTRTDAELLKAQTSGIQSNRDPQIVSLPDGGWVVIWRYSTGFQETVLLQAYDADGTKRGDEIQAAESNSRIPLERTITVLADGGWVVTWDRDDSRDGDSSGIFQHVYNADGTERGQEQQVNTTWQGYQGGPRTTALADGGWVVTWSDGNGLYQQVYNSDATPRGDETRISLELRTLQEVVTLTDGGWVVTWDTRDTSGGSRIDLQVYNADGTMRGEVTHVNTATIAAYELHRVIALPDGGWVVNWTSHPRNDDGYDIYQQAYNADGTVRGSETRVNTETAGDQKAPEIELLADGGWIVTWTSNGQDGDGRGIYQQRFDATGQRYGSNHAPEAADKTVMMLEDNDYTFSTSDFGFLDDEGDSLLAVIISAIPTAGTLRLDGVAVGEGDSIDIADIVAGKLVYTPASNDNGEGIDGFTFRVRDNGGTEGGGIDTSVPHAITFDVTPVNDPPMAEDVTVSMFEDKAFTFSAEIFGFADIDGDNFNSVTINSLPGSGTFMLDGIAVAVDQQIDVADLGLLVWKPAKDAFGVGLASFSFSVTDGGGTANGGIDSSANYLFTFDVTDVVDRFNGTKRSETITGTAGADILWGGKGADKLTGGDGADTFLFKSIAESTLRANGRDLIKDFSRAEDDLIDLSRIDANTTKKGNQAFDFIGKQGFHDVAGELRFEKTGYGTYVYGDVDGDGVADFAIRLAGKIAFRGDDFLL